MQTSSRRERVSLLQLKCEIFHGLGPSGKFGASIAINCVHVVYLVMLGVHVLIAMGQEGSFEALGSTSPSPRSPKGERRRSQPGKSPETSASTPWARKHRNIVRNNGVPIAQWLITPFASLLRRRLGMGLLLLPSQCFLLPPHTKSSPREARCLLRSLGHRNTRSHRLQPTIQCA